MKNKNALLLTTCAMACIIPLDKTRAENATALTIVKPQHVKLSAKSGVYSKKSHIAAQKSVKLQQNTNKSSLSCITGEHKTNYRIPTDIVKEQINALKTYVSAQGRSPEIIDILYSVAEETDTDFTLLAVKALMESDLGRITVAEHSSARGIYQYIEPTWLALMKRYGNRIGQEESTKHIKFNVNKGLLEIESANEKTKNYILDLRNDVKTATLIKAYQIKDETAALQTMKGARITATDHYIVHMLGLGMARTFYAMKNANSPIQMASLRTQTFAEAVNLNKSFFYNKNNVPLTATQAYDQFQDRIGAQYKKLHMIHTTYGQLPTIGNGARKCTLAKTTLKKPEASIIPLPNEEKTKKKTTKPVAKTVSMTVPDVKKPAQIETETPDNTPKPEKSNMDLINAAIDKYRVKLRQ